MPKYLLIEEIPRCFTVPKGEGADIFICESRKNNKSIPKLKLTKIYFKKLELITIRNKDRKKSVRTFKEE